MAEYHRGAVHTASRARQLRDFTGLCYGKITPTDIDALIEYHAERYVIIEAKLEWIDYDDNSGQAKALERMCDDLAKTKPTILIVFKHHTPEDQAIDFAQGIVEKYRLKQKWYLADHQYTVKSLTDWFLLDYKR